MGKLTAGMRRKINELISRADVIEMPDMEGIKKIEEWTKQYTRSNNPELTMDDILFEQAPFEQVVLHFKRSQGVPSQDLYFSKGENEALFACREKKEVLEIFKYKRGDGGIYGTENGVLPLEDLKMMAIMFVKVFLFILEYREEREYVQGREMKSVETKKGKKGKKQSRKIPIRKTVYQFTLPAEMPQPRKSFERRTDTWGVRGHWREYKSGKRVWIKPYIKGDIEKQPEPKTYKL